MWCRLSVVHPEDTEATLSTLPVKWLSSKAARQALWGTLENRIPVRNRTGLQPKAVLEGACQSVQETGHRTTAPSPHLWPWLLEQREAQFKTTAGLTRSRCSAYLPFCCSVAAALFLAAAEFCFGGSLPACPLPVFDLPAARFVQRGADDLVCVKETQ